MAFRLLPGGAVDPALAHRRRVIGISVVVVAAALQTLPMVLRTPSVTVLAVRFALSLALLAIIVVALSAVYDANARRRAGVVSTVTSTLLVSCAIAAVYTVATRALLRDVIPFHGAGETDFPLLRTTAFGAIVGLLHAGVWALAFAYPLLAEDARLRTLEADKLRTAAELARLRSQLEPHFLLNTLNTIAGLVTEDPREARRLLACLGDLLRDSLRDADDLQTVDDEVAWLKRYAAILESRHAGSLEFRWAVDDAAGRMLLPRLLLQPLVENAVKHGALRRRGGGIVTIRASMNEGRLVCAVEDNGPGLAAVEPREGAFGVRSVRRRLELRYPAAELRLESGNDGARSIIEMPAAERELA